jgi:hypothetical protein
MPPPSPLAACGTRWGEHPVRRKTVERRKGGRSDLCPLPTPPHHALPRAHHTPATAAPVRRRCFGSGASHLPHPAARCGGCGKRRCSSTATGSLSNRDRRCCCRRRLAARAAEQQALATPGPPPWRSPLLLAQRLRGAPAIPSSKGGMCCHAQRTPGSARGEVSSRKVMKSIVLSSKLVSTGNCSPLHRCHRYL